MATMEKASRIVRCPKCLALLQEPPPGIPLYKCGHCSTVLRAKHASSDGSGTRRLRAQQLSRPTPPVHAETGSVDGRNPSKLNAPDLPSRQPSVDEPGDFRSRPGNLGLSLADIGKKSPNNLLYSSFPPGPAPTHVPSTTNTYADNGSRTGQDHLRRVPHDSLASPSREKDLLSGREFPIYMLQTKVSSSARVEETFAGKKSLNDWHRSILSPPTDKYKDPPATDEKGDLVGMRTKNPPANVNVITRQTADLVDESSRYRPPSAGMTRENVNTRQKSPPGSAHPMQLSPDTSCEDVKTRQKLPPEDLVAEAAPYQRSSTDMTSEGANNRTTERQGTSEAEDDRNFSPSKALAALRLQNAGPLYRVKERQAPGLGPTRKSQGSLSRGRNKSQGDESTGAGNTDFGLRLDKVEPDPSARRTNEEIPHRRQHSDGVAISERSHEDVLYAGSLGLSSGSTWTSEDEVKGVGTLSADPTAMLNLSENERKVLHGLKMTVDNENSRDNDLSAGVDEEKVTADQKSISRGSSSNIARQLNETISGSPATEQSLPPASDVSLVRRISAELKEPKEKQSVSEVAFDDESKLEALQDNSPSESPRTNRKPLSPPRFLSESSVIGGVQPQPEHLSKTRVGARQELAAPSTLQVYNDPPNVLDYDTSEDSSNVDDTDQYQIVSKPHSEELKLPTFSHGEQLVEADAAGGGSGRLDEEGEEDPADTRSTNSRSLDKVGVSSSFGPVQSGGSPYFSPGQSPDSIHSESSPQAQTSDQRKQGTFSQAPDALESANSFSFGHGGPLQGQPYSSLKGQTQKVRLQINTAIPERIHVRCRHCKLQLEVPTNLARSETGVQRLRCGSCWRISRFRLNHLLSPSGTSSPAGSDRSPESSFRLDSSDGASGRYSGTRSNRETGAEDREVIRTQSGASLPVPPAARHNPRGATGSKLSNMVSNIPSEASKTSTPNSSGDLDTAGSSTYGGKDMIVALSQSGQGEPPRTSLSPTMSSTSQDVSSKDRPQKITSPDRRLLQSSSDSDEEKPSAQLKMGSSATNPIRMPTWSAPETPEFDDGHEFKGLKGFFKKSVKELTKGKKSTQYRRKVTVNGNPVPDDVVRRAEEFSGVIRPGSYWYDFRAGFWGVMGGPCVGMIPPFIDELNFSLSRHCSHGKTGVLVNGRELHHKDLELLKKRGLPGTPGKSYNVDIDGRLTEETSGIELKGLGRLAPTLEQTGRSPGMWVPESQRGS